MSRLRYAERIILVGPTKSGRMLAIILASKGRDKYYPVTAYTASRRMRKNYEGEKGGEKHG
ncbi:hypothetical protein A3D84_00155 [Candidatus Woesebacteria bacterium RIFCSPHIGHO2_02_FULL_42_20]|nr:MAG: hypothetical protein A2W15_01655 [Candidatus Woesebacteria bacterium RBG_16_41_13]OGM35193.1 MAG: hypothetical protein A3D84_00155 [Candidatus Woesebacteria bacterium RIFCSPHIGHO2_02_FULL_42_20]